MFLGSTGSSVRSLRLRVAITYLHPLTRSAFAIQYATPPRRTISSTELAVSTTNAYSLVLLIIPPKSSFILMSVLVGFFRYFLQTVAMLSRWTFTRVSGGTPVDFPIGPACVPRYTTIDPA